MELSIRGFILSARVMLMHGHSVVRKEVHIKGLFFNIRLYHNITTYENFTGAHSRM